jgi:hypothetical protein
LIHDSLLLRKGAKVCAIPGRSLCDPEPSQPPLDSGRSTEGERTINQLVRRRPGDGISQRCILGRLLVLLITVCAIRMVTCQLVPADQHVVEQWL